MPNSYPHDRIFILYLTNEPPHDKTEQNDCAPSERSAWASAQPDQESSLCALWVANDPSFLHADSDDSDQTRLIPRLIWVFDGRTCHFVGFVMRQLLWYWILWWNYHCLDDKIKSTVSLLNFVCECFRIFCEVGIVTKISCGKLFTWIQMNNKRNRLMKIFHRWSKRKNWYMWLLK